MSSSHVRLGGIRSWARHVTSRAVAVMGVSATMVACISATGDVARAEPIPRAPLFLPLETSIKTNPGRADTVHRDFEAVALQALLAPMLEQDRGGLYGGGAAGKQWQALLTEQIAKQMAASGQLRLSAAAPPVRARPKAATSATRITNAPTAPCREPTCGVDRLWTTIVVVSSDTEHVDTVETGWQTRIIDAEPELCTSPRDG